MAGRCERARRAGETPVKSVIAMRSAGALLAVWCLPQFAAPAWAAELPSYFKPIVGTWETSRGEIANRDILQLNTTMFELYGDAAQKFKQTILVQHPVILGLFSGAGGQFILYRPGKEPLHAPSVPIVYQLLKSVGHSTMALGEIVTPYLNSPKDLGWRGSMASYRSRMQS